MLIGVDTTAQQRLWARAMENAIWLQWVVSEWQYLSKEESKVVT